MKKIDVIWWGFITLVIATSFAHMVRSIYLSAIWDDCLATRVAYESDARVKIIDKCAAVLRQPN